MKAIYIQVGDGRSRTILTIPRASTLESVREWPHIFADLGLFGFSSERFWANNGGSIIMRNLHAMLMGTDTGFVQAV